MHTVKPLSTSYFRHLVSRFAISILASLVAIASVAIFTVNQLFKAHYTLYLISFAFVLSTIFAQVYLYISNKKNFDMRNSLLREKQIPTFLQKLYILAIASALGWSFLSCSLIFHLGGFQRETIFLYLILICLCSSAGPSLAHNRVLWSLFVGLVLGVPVLYSCSMDWHHNGMLTAIFFLLGGLFYRAQYTSAEYIFGVTAESGDKNVQIEYFHSIIEAVPGLVTIFDKELRYHLVNSRVFQFTGLKESHFIGKKLGDNYSNEFVEMVHRFSTSELDSHQARMQLRGSAGPRWFIVTLSRLVKDNQVVAVSLDIDDHMKAEAIVAEQRLAAESSARLVAMGELAAGIAHEINNPLAVITSKSEQIIRKMGTKNQTDFIPDMEKIKATGFRIASIVRGLKNLSRNNESDPYVPHKVYEVMRDITAIFEEKLKSHSITLKTNIPEDALMECRSAQIGQVLMNLTANAFDVLKDSPGSWIQIDAKQIGEFMEISVMDSGPGITDEVKKKLMTPFFTTKAAGSGTGLGLSISRRIATDHNGQLYLDEASKHTRFVLKIPIHQSRVHAA
jgi:signal transduction histidine kinase